MKKLTISKVCLLLGLTISLGACSPTFNKNQNEAAQEESTPFFGYVKNLLRSISGGNHLASSTSYKLKGVSVGSVVKQESSSASFKNKEELGEKIQGN